MLMLIALLLFLILLTLIAILLGKMIVETKFQATIITYLPEIHKELYRIRRLAETTKENKR